MATYLLFGITYAFAAVVQPGPFQAYIISETLSRGWKRTLPAIFSPLLSDIPISILTLLLLSRVGAEFFQFLHCGGGIFLLYLSIRLFMTWKNFSTESGLKSDIESNRQTLLKAVFVNILNPNTYIGWSLILGPLFLKGWRESPINGISLLLAFYCTMIIGLLGMIMLLALAKNFGSSVNRAGLGLSAAALGCFGIYQLWICII